MRRDAFTHGPAARTRADAAAEAARQIEIMAALRATALRDFGMSWFLVAPGVADDAPRSDWIDAAQPRVAFRAHGRRWILSTLEAAHLALTLRLTRRWCDEGQGVTVMDLIADALAAAAREAEARLSDLRGVA